MKTLVLITLFFCISACSSVSKKDKTSKEVERETNTCNFPKFSQEVNGLFFENDLSKIEAYFNKHQVDMNSRGIFCKTLTHEAVRNPKLLEFFLARGAPLDEISDFKETPLSEAVENNIHESARILLKKGARTYLIHSFDNSLMFKALNRADEAMVDLLIEYQACPLGVGFMGKTLAEVAKDDLIREKILNYRDWFIKNKKTCTPAIKNPSQK